VLPVGDCLTGLSDWSDETPERSFRRIDPSRHRCLYSQYSPRVPFVSDLLGRFARLTVSPVKTFFFHHVTVRNETFPGMCQKERGISVYPAPPVHNRILGGKLPTIWRLAGPTKGVLHLNSGFLNGIILDAWLRIREHPTIELLANYRFFPTNAHNHFMLKTFFAVPPPKRICDPPDGQIRYWWNSRCSLRMCFLCFSAPSRLFPEP